MNLDFSCNGSSCYIFNACDSDNPSRILHLAFALKSYALDKTDADTLYESFLAGELTGEVKIIRSITGEKPRPETQELAGFGRNSIKVGSSTHTINFMDQHAVQNIDFYNAFKFESGKYDLYFFTDGLCWDASAQLITFYGDPVFTNGPTDLIQGEATIKWTAKTSPSPFPEAFPTTDLEEGLYYIISSATYPSGQITMLDNATVTTSLTAALSQYVANSCDLVWSIVQGSDTTLATVSIDSSTGELSIEGNEDPGTFTLTVQVENDCGGCVQGTFEVTVILTAA